MSALHYRERPSCGPPAGLLILHHGRGSDEHDLLALGELLDPTQRLRVVTPRAPLRPPGAIGNHWYLVPRVGHPDPTTFQSARRALAELHDELLDSTDVPASRLFLGGFSMGAVMSYAMGLDLERPAPGAILAFSGFIPTVADWQPDGGRGSPVFVAHGTRDAVISVDFAREAVARLRAGAIDVEYHESDTGHQIDPAHALAAREWLDALVDGTT